MEISTVQSTIQLPNHDDVDVIIEFSYDVNKDTEVLEVWGADVPRTTYEAENIEILSVTVDGDYLNENDEVVWADGTEIKELCDDIDDVLVDTANDSIEFIGE